MNDAIDFSRIYSFNGNEAAYIVELLQSVYDIRTANGEEDLVLGDFITALDNGDKIIINDD
jgi:hypothetical protein